MNREKWLAVLKNMTWEPCGDSHGLPRYREVEAYHCTFCAYTVCARCYNAIPTALLFPSRDARTSDGRDSPGLREEEDEENQEAEDHSSLKNDSLLQKTAVSEEDFSKPHCFLCRKGDLVHERLPVHEWTCEGPRPARRLQRGNTAAYDMDVVQRYYTMQEQREKRARSREPLVARFHAAEGPSTHFVSSSGSASDGAKAVLDVIGGGLLNRRPFSEEGAGFIFSVQNPRMEVPCVWCAVNRRLSEAHPSFVGDETITPLQIFRCPPSLPGIPPRRFRVGVPYGLYGLHNVHALALYLMDDMFRKATSELQMRTADVLLTADENKHHTQSQRGQLQAGKVLPRHVVRPLLVVEILHRIATSDPLPALLSAELCGSHVRRSLLGPPSMQAQTTDSDNAHNDDSKVDGDDDYKEGKKKEEDEEDEEGVDVEGGGTSVLMWPDGLRCEELLLALDYLLQGRSVAVYGISSKYFFLQHLSHCAELRHHGVVVLDGYRASTTRIVNQLGEIRRQLGQRREAERRALLRSFVARDAYNEPLEPDARSRAPEREPQLQHEEQGEEEQGEQGVWCWVDSKSLAESPRSQSCRTPLRSCIGEKGASQSRGKGADSALDDGLLPLRQSHLWETPSPRKAVGAVPVTSSSFTAAAAANSTRTRESSIPLVCVGAEDGGKGTESFASAKHPPWRQQKQQRQRVVGERQDEVPLPSEHDAGTDVAKACAWLQRHWIREQSEWNYDLSLRHMYGCKRPREDGGDEKNKDNSHSSNNNKSYNSGDDAMSLFSSQYRRSRPPRITVSSPELMRSLRLKCRAPLRKCVEWMSLPSVTAQGLLPSTDSIILPPPVKSDACATIIVLHGVDQLDPPAMIELQAIAREFPYRVLLLCSFDDPNWPLSSTMGLLDSFRMMYVHLRSLLLPRVREMSAINSLSLLTELEASGAGGGRFSRYGNHGEGFAAGISLPLHDTIRRVLFSLPAAFSELLRCMIKRQEASGENVFVPMSLHHQNFDECGMMVSMARLKAIERELTSNRLAVFNSAENKLMIPQHRKLLKVLEEVLEQRHAAKSESGGAAPVEA